MKWVFGCDTCFVLREDFLVFLCRKSAVFFVSDPPIAHVAGGV